MASVMQEIIIILFVFLISALKCFKMFKQFSIAEINEIVQFLMIPTPSKLKLENDLHYYEHFCYFFFFLNKSVLLFIKHALN